MKIMPDRTSFPVAVRRIILPVKIALKDAKPNDKILFLLLGIVEVV
jgi:hypothetical protein